MNTEIGFCAMAREARYQTVQSFTSVQLAESAGSHKSGHVRFVAVGLVRDRTDVAGEDARLYCAYF